MDFELFMTWLDSPNDDGGGFPEEQFQRLISPVENKTAIKCYICDRVFTNYSLYKSHINVHNGIYPHACHLCGYKCSYPGALANHVRDRHNIHVKYKCECGNVFSTRKEFINHRNVHKEKYKYKCEVPSCGRLFSSQYRLNQHTHESPNTCAICGKSYSRKYDLSMHMLTHEAILFACPECGYKCKTKLALSRHLHALHRISESN